MFDDLIHDLENATEGRAELGARILAAVRNANLLSVEKYGEELWIALEDTSNGERYEIKHLKDPTLSLDAALTLIPNGCRYEIVQSINGQWFDATIYRLGEDDEFIGETPGGVRTAALAIVIAALHARLAPRIAAGEPKEEKPNAV